MTRMLVVSTVARSLALQSPGAWPLARARGLELTFAAAEDSWSDILRRHGAVVPLRASRTLAPGAVRALAADLRSLAGAQHWDLVQVQTPIVAALWRLVAPAAVRRRTVYVAHGLHFQRGDRSAAALAYRTVEALLAHRALGVATVAHEDAAWLARLPSPLRPRHTWALPGAGVDVARFRRAQPPAQAPRRYALFCGDLNANKDPMLAVEAVEAARVQHPGLGLIVIGEGPLRAELDTVAASRPWLCLIDRTEQMEQWVAGAAVLLAPSHREGVPRVVIEALAAGTPVVARTNRGSRELLSGGVGTILPREAGAEEWARALRGALEAAPPRAAMSERAASYDVAAFEAAYEDLLTTVLGDVLVA
jgi:glycosyltransferase involved in cell wall biosynthesis